MIAMPAALPRWGRLVSSYIFIAGRRIICMDGSGYSLLEDFRQFC